MTYAALLRQTANRLAARDIYADWPNEDVSHQTQAEAEQLVCHITGWRRLQMLQHLTQCVPQEIIARLEALSARRVAGDPLAYLIGEIDFYGRAFLARPGCLIPRPDTEVLVHLAATWIETHLPVARVVDIGAGSGCIAVTLACECPRAQVHAVDISADAVALTKDNAARLDAPLTVVKADGFAWLRERAAEGACVNVIVSNPPYIPSADIAGLDADVKRHEPHLALDGGSDGLHFYRQFAALAPTDVFAPGPAALFLEVGQGQAEMVAALFDKQPAWAGFSPAIHADLRGVHRVVALTRAH
ncbi:peptide chain release factor N(5)-glutamine methyltransferase [Alicyclobacillus fodiniaquatilis]|uniref:Release factor glutamine methyltransferase n=1 Tax=Alicyclobacillus fodiniaquatilis TaxID=1661150 RepID=A0ABW4JK41_9BACL